MSKKYLQKHLAVYKKKSTFAFAFADMAQLVEHRIRNAWVPGSSPGIGSKAKEILHFLRQ